MLVLIATWFLSNATLPNEWRLNAIEMYTKCHTNARQNSMLYAISFEKFQAARASASAFECLILSWRRWSRRLHHFLSKDVRYYPITRRYTLCHQRKETYPNHPGANLDQRLILCKSNIGKKWSMACDGGICVALQVRPPLPARRIRVACPDVFGLQAL